jgi:hypothetical protein
MGKLNLTTCDVEGCEESTEKPIPAGFRRLSTNVFGAHHHADCKWVDICPTHAEIVRLLLNGTPLQAPEPEKVEDPGDPDDWLTPEFAFDDVRTEPADYDGEAEIENDDPDGVHRAHCCELHGCKYETDSCPVAKHLNPGQTMKGCEDCSYLMHEIGEINAELQRLPGDLRPGLIWDTCTCGKMAEC